MKTKKTILSAGAIAAFSMTLALGLSANVDQGSYQQGSALQGVHPPTQYGTPGERTGGYQPAPVMEPEANRQQRQSSLNQNREETREFGRRSESSSHLELSSNHESHKASDILSKKVEIVLYKIMA